MNWAQALLEFERLSCGVHARLREIATVMRFNSRQSKGWYSIAGDDGDLIERILRCARVKYRRINERQFTAFIPTAIDKRLQERRDG